MPSAIRLVFHSAGTLNDNTIQTSSAPAAAIKNPADSNTNECPKASISESECKYFSTGHDRINASMIPTAPMAQFSNNSIFIIILLVYPTALNILISFVLVCIR